MAERIADVSMTNDQIRFVFGQDAAACGSQEIRHEFIERSGKR